jgi:tetratricopeptide (TPR) repeat protein
MVEELRGLLAVGVLPEILRRVFLARRTGSLHLASGVDRSDVEFAGGYLVNAATTLPGANLGDLLVQSGLLSARDRDACLEIAALSGERLGETLLRHGLLDHDQLAQGLGLQLREVLVRSLVWSGGVYTFADAPPRKPPASGFEEPRLDPREILLDATWTLVGDPALTGLLGDTSQRLRKASDERLLYLDFRLTPEDAFLLSRVDGKLTADQLLELSPANVDEARASLAGLLAVGAIEYVDAPPATSVTTQVSRLAVTRLASRINSSDPYEILGLKADASTEELRSAYLKLLKSCDPASTTDPEFRSILGQMSKQLTEAFKEIERRRGEARPAALRRGADRQARATAPPLVPKASGKTEPPGPPSVSRKTPQPSPAAAPKTPAPEARAAAKAHLDPSQANEAAAKAQEEGRFLEALAILHEAIPHLSGQARRIARVRKARVLLAVENGAKLAEEELKAALVEDAGNADAHVALGGIYRERGSLALAMMEYRKALDLQPKHAAAREALKELRAAPPADKAAEESMLKRIFGR